MSKPCGVFVACYVSNYPGGTIAFERNVYDLHVLDFVSLKKKVADIFFVDGARKRLKLENIVEFLNKYDYVLFSTVGSMVLKKDSHFLDFVFNINSSVKVFVFCHDTVEKSKRTFFLKDAPATVERSDAIISYRKFDFNGWSVKKHFVFDRFVYPVFKHDVENFKRIIEFKENAVRNVSNFEGNKGSDIILDFLYFYLLRSSDYEINLYVRNLYRYYNRIKFFLDAGIKIYKSHGWNDMLHHFRKFKVGLNFTKFDCYGTTEYAILDSVKYGLVPVVLKVANHSNEFLLFRIDGDQLEIDSVIRTAILKHREIIYENFDRLVKFYSVSRQKEYFIEKMLEIFNSV